MKKAVKYIVLSVSCIATFLVLLLMTLLLVDSKNLTNPATLILPMISFLVLIAGFIMITIWGFKFSNDKNHKQFLIIALCIFVASVLLFAVSKATNSAMKEAAITSVQVENGYINVSVEEFKDKFNEQLDSGYNKIQFFDMLEKSGSSYHYYKLSKDITIALLATPDGSMLKGATLSLDTEDINGATDLLWYYCAKLTYAFSPNLTNDEMMNIASKLNLASPLPGDNDIFLDGGLIYTKQFENGRLQFSILASDK